MLTQFARAVCVTRQHVGGHDRKMRLEDIRMISRKPPLESPEDFPFERDHRRRILLPDPIDEFPRHLNYSGILRPALEPVQGALEHLSAARPVTS
jgi:hypothetical protein